VTEAAAPLREGGPTLAEGSVYERLRRRPDVPFDPQVGTGALVRDDAFRDLLADVHRGYLRLALDAGRPMLLQTDTWRATGPRIAASRWRGENLNAATAALVRAVADEGRRAGGTVLVGGLLGPAGDAYDPSAALPREAAHAYHAPQAEALAAGAVDLLVCATVPALSEALGLADAMAATGRPYLVSVVVRPTGRLLDGTPLAEAVATIDGAADPAPLGYLLNCVHPRVADAALAASPPTGGRLLGLLANTSARDPDELDGLAELETAEPEPFAGELVAVARRRDLRLLGGCCGTGDEHIAALARLLAEREGADLVVGRTARGRAR
jgi:homocysteine S-methyltransferase